jgi:hypothetical protein
LTISFRTAILLFALFTVLIFSGIRLATDAVQTSLSDIITTEPAARIPAIIIRYDIEECTQEQLLTLMRQDRELGLRASVFPLVEDLERVRNTVQRYAIQSGEVALHAKPMPAGLANAWVVSNDPTPYQYDYLDKEEMIESYRHNIAHELKIFASNGFPVSGFSLHSYHNRLPWTDDENYKILAVVAGAAGFECLSVTTQAFSIGDDLHPFRSAKFNRYDRDVTVRQKPFWADIRTGWFRKRSVLVIPTYWRERYGVGLFGQETVEGVFRIMREDIERQWQAAMEVGAPLVLLFHPVGSLRREEKEEAHFRLRRILVERARAENIPIMTFSEYHSAALAER